MGVIAYPTDINTVSSDIELVGGAGAFEWMIREDAKGYKYILRKLDGDLAAGLAAGTIVSRTLVSAGNTTVAVFGVNATGNDALSGDYLWLMVFGIARMVTDNTVIEGEFVASGGGKAVGVAANATTYYLIGHAMETDDPSNPTPNYADVFVDPFTTRTAP